MALTVTYSARQCRLMKVARATIRSHRDLNVSANVNVP